MRSDESNALSKSTIFEIVEDFCLRYDLDPEEVGDAIRDDKYFSELLYNECKKQKIINVRGEVDNIDAEEW